MLLFKIIQSKKPSYLSDKLSGEIRTIRQTDATDLRDQRCFKTSTANKSFIPRTILHWNELPSWLKQIESVTKFKTHLKVYIKENVPIK